MKKTSILSPLLLAAVAALAGTHAQAAVNSINLGNYAVTGTYALDTLSDMGLEASAVTYARDRNSLFFVGDEGMGVVEISLTGQTLGSMAFSNWPVTSTNNDAEGLTYLGGGVLVVAEERLQDAFRFNYVAGSSVALASADYVSIAATVGNVGTEGISYDPRNGSLVSVKQDNPQAVLAGNLTFAPAGGVSSMTALFDADSVLGLASLSDVQTLSPVDALAGTAAADNLLILSLDSRKLIEINRSGDILSSFDLSGVTTQAIEGVTVDQNGTIYLVAEDSGTANSKLFVLTAAPVPEAETYAMMLAGLGLVGFMARRKSQRA
ncbi:SdiA-regulated domain-containing protein [Sulfuriferula sp.]|uniref:SdiA-regulated domain-containing protein n=1 Tax=Sulfuriferula sp. TaxID=2025307 RepID=UPI0027305B6C|nr:SdiA-regulated domain-containing protein [Sulfuriferula sp.]MDP2025598.1 SdiA-regulated domain-containing protein [Sulfuriferula sp.]